ncbi:hypothetical protein [Metabacillus sp. 84]|uniref:hypothetical protein n=1 Tax=Metabacillus sp. 84 TaxID=3404705 RepID=UPI003CE9F221
MQPIETLVLFLVVFATLYSCMKIFNDLPKSKKMQNFIAVMPSFAGVLAFLLMEFVLPTTESPMVTLTTNVFPTLMIAVTIGLLLKVKAIRSSEI